MNTIDKQGLIPAGVDVITSHTTRKLLSALLVFGAAFWIGMAPSVGAQEEEEDEGCISWELCDFICQIAYSSNCVWRIGTEDSVGNDGCSFGCDV